MKNLIIQSQYQKDSLTNLLKNKIDSLEEMYKNFEEKYKEIQNIVSSEETEKVFAEELLNFRKYILENKNLLDQLNRMGDFI